MELFKYKPIDLNRSTIRLVRLLRGEFSDINCELLQIWLDERDKVVPYNALSYTWGEEKGESIILDGKLLSVTKNLFSALQNLRSAASDTLLWIDAICIDQTNPEERGHQVGQMGEIFHQAARVLFWLGEATPETNSLMDALKILEEESIKYALKGWRLGDKHWMGLWSTVQAILYDRDQTIL
jgi:hypothetical protein